ncbi:Uracil-DNA glycosylase [Clarias magur]|uniref:Uracil-DNA glycosylase n=1 Tax=Clarias magur TaxID=1594786 RepID=A0A8J4TCI3_CLAMG|nr:Uracil-DNA glycosylase [Clarias magur]
MSISALRRGTSMALGSREETSWRWKHHHPGELGVNPPCNRRPCLISVLLRLLLSLFPLHSSSPKGCSNVISVM